MCDYQKLLYFVWPTFRFQDYITCMQHDCMELILLYMRHVCFAGIQRLPIYRATVSTVQRSGSQHSAEAQRQAANPPEQQRLNLDSQEASGKAKKSRSVKDILNAPEHRQVGLLRPGRVHTGFVLCAVAAGAGCDLNSKSGFVGE